MQYRILLIAVFILLFSGCCRHSDQNAQSVQRHVWVTGLKAEKADYYRRLHANPWPGVNRMLKSCNIRNYTISEIEIGGQTYLFSYLEYTGKNFDEDMKKMAADPETVRWWKETDPCQQPLPAAAAQGKIWSDAKVVYHLE